MALLFRHVDPPFTLADRERVTMPDVYRLGPEESIDRLWGER